MPRRHVTPGNGTLSLGVGTNDVLYGTLTPEYSRGVTFDLGKKFLDVFVLGIWFEEMPFTISIRAIQKPSVFLFVFLKSGYWRFRPY